MLVDPTSRAASPIWQRGYAAIDVDIKSPDTLIILDQGPGGGCLTSQTMLLRFDLNTGTTTTIVSGGLMFDTQAAVILPST
jgi:hypothetical protein